MERQTVLISKNNGTGDGQTVSFPQIFALLYFRSSNNAYNAAQRPIFTRRGCCSLHSYGCDSNLVYRCFHARKTLLSEDLLSSNVHRNCSRKRSHAMSKPVRLGLDP